MKGEIYSMNIRQLIPVFLILGIISYMPTFQEIGAPWPVMIRYVGNDTLNLAILLAPVLLIGWFVTWYLNKP